MVNRKRNDLTQLVLAVVAIFLVNYIVSFTNLRWDLTAEKRYSLNDVTKNLINTVDDVILFKIYLEGDLNSGFQKLQRETRQMLNELKAYNGNIEYEFINPNESDDKKLTKDIYEQLRFKGLEPIQVEEQTADGASVSFIFPGAVVSYKDRELPVQLLLNQFASSPEAQLNISIQNLEYTLANSVRKLTLEEKPTVAFLKGHGELSDKYVADLAKDLSQYYNVDKFNLKEFIADSITGEVSLNNQVLRLNTIDALIIAKPTKPFNDIDKLLLDQYIMRGGKTLWFVDAVSANMDSLSKASSFLSYPIMDQLGLTEFLFKYGVRINANLVQDMVAAGVSDTRNVYRWIYFPLVMPQVKHPITKDLNAIKLEFASTVDTIIAPGIKKTFMLRSSPYSRTVSSPHSVSLRTLRKNHTEQEFTRQFLPMGVLLEGEFNSAFANRVVPRDNSGQPFSLIKKGRKTEMLVVADGDIIKNQLNVVNPNIPRGVPLPLGYDQYTGMQYGNKDFIMNAVDYMLDESGLIEIRSRELKLRLLDNQKIKENKLYWQILNVGAPILLIILFGFVYNRVRKKKFAS
ncbi:MAG: gliding motility-associated ABC transporter substrate-binding protein GldG [Schleiferiaceae bacterium]|jgi:ABC-2 type transport system permease protein|nr:gliding motility-associated ABC transporter substrate-binding protein GldG [Schleiferiaceae bacterium]